MEDFMEERYNICHLNDIMTIKQSKYYYCAAASLKMCLNLKESQDEIFNKLELDTKDKENWYAEPDAVYKYLKNYGHFKRTSEFVNNSIDATENIISSLLQNNLSYPMLVSHGKHWVVYAGYQMNENGQPTGIYIKDPWPTTATLSFFPFSDYFFSDYFNIIDVEGCMKNKVESFIPENVNKCISLDVFKKAKGGGVRVSDIECFKNEIIINDLKSFGISNISEPRYGGGIIDDILVYDKNMNEKFYLSFMELNNSLIISAIEIGTLLTIGFIYANIEHINLFSYDNIATKLNETRENIKFIYDEKLCNSCFTPLIKCKNKLYDLSLDIKYELGEINERKI